ncbi:hypothetical protein [Nocardioides sambongensis]|uniref:hypothetical protein n=1 Tax=Nocardioides sambongensis TaxID=2589074 RepID=UPI0011289B35|nr:hypothetical protein [Nocardioides sambongensis]
MEDNRTTPQSDDLPQIRSVRISDDPYAGPFWEDGVHISSHYDELSAWIGISKELFDKIAAWHGTFNANATPPRWDPDRDEWIAEKERRRSKLTKELRAEIGGRFRIDPTPGR